MTETTRTSLIEKMAHRRERLGMSFDVLAQRSGVSAPTLKRMLSPRELHDGSPSNDTSTPVFRGSLRNVHAVASALGMALTAEPELSADELCERQAETKARELVALVQGTSALEAQGLPADTIAQMVEDAKRELLSGPRRRLWGGAPEPTHG